jgi:hypothetical protein
MDRLKTLKTHVSQWLAKSTHRQSAQYQATLLVKTHRSIPVLRHPPLDQEALSEIKQAALLRLWE